VIPSSAKAGDSALEALVDAAAGILSADSLPGTLGRIAHHLAALVPHDDLSLYEIEDGGKSLKPVFAVGDWVDEIMSEEISVQSGVTGWVVRNRRTRNVPNTLHEPLCTVVTGTDEVAEAFVAVPLIAHDRVVGSLNVYRTGADVPFSNAEVELVERFATMAALAYDSARQRDLLREEVRTDSLTGLLNHRGSQERLRAALDEADGRPVSVVVIDLDHFKRINDTFGHAEGDRALALAATALREVVRETDAVGRLGGEEFVLVLPGVDAPAAREAAERARVAVSEVQIGGRQLACSAGLACHPDDAGDAPGLLLAADAALYAAKDKGRGRTCRYRPSLALRPSPGEEREEIEAILRDPATQLSAAFQPVLELATGRVSGYEALARFHAEPRLGPDEWFAQAHRVGLCSVGRSSATPWPATSPRSWSS
jgi:diguanylate cyclase (GGDEF)-like protein